MSSSTTPPHCHVTPHARGTPANIRTYLLFPETRVIGLNFAADRLIVWVYLHSIFFLVGSVKRNFSARVHIGRSRSSKVIDFGTGRLTNRKRVCDFPSVIVTLVLPCLVSEILQVFCSETDHQLHSARILGVFPSRWRLGSDRPCWGQSERKP